MANRVILYHGSNVNIDKIDLTICHPYKDFGKGFYTTEYLASLLEYKKLTNQISFHTEASIKYLRKQDVIYG
jgi:hypothetical protein